MANLSGAASSGLNLAVEIAYMTTDTVETLLSKAFREAKEVALEGCVLAPDLVEEILVRAERQAQALQSQT